MRVRAPCLEPLKHSRGQILDRYARQDNAPELGHLPLPVELGHLELHQRILPPHEPPQHVEPQGEPISDALAAPDTGDDYVDVRCRREVVDGNAANVLEQLLTLASAADAGATVGEESV